MLAYRDGTDPGDVSPLCRLGLEGVAEGVIVGIPMTPAQMLEDQERALTRMIRAVAVAGDVRAVGLGSLCAVVASRGEALAERVPMPVTTGAAATAWALWQNVRAVHALRGGPVAIVGASGAVGGAVAALLAEEGVPLRLDHPRAARNLAEAQGFSSPAEAVAGCGLIVGAGPTGATLPAAAVSPGAIVVDVALPATILGRTPRGVRVLAGEAVSLPAGWRRDGWGQLYHLLAGYGPWQVFACLVEPLILAASGRDAPFALGRRVDPLTVRAFGEAAAALGFQPRLARGWTKISQATLRSWAGRQLPG